VHRSLLAISLLVAAAGCTNTGAETDPLIPNELVVRGVQITSLSTLVGTEVARVASEPPEGFSTCPEVDEEGDVWTFDYGAEGCVPDSGVTEDLVVGTVELTIAGGSGAFLGTVTGMGVGTSTMTAEVSGSTSSAGDLLTADIDFGTATWTRDTVEFSWDAFVEITGDADEIGLTVDQGVLTAVNGGEPLYVDIEEVATPRDGVAGCAVPGGGSITLVRDLGRSNLDFTEDTHTSGSITATHNDRDPAAVTPCE